METQQVQKNQPKKRLNKEDIKAFLKTDRAILMICISIAFVFWLTTKMSYSYKDSVLIDIKYTVPNGKIFTYPPASQLEVDIQGSGWDLLGIAFSSAKREVNIPLSPDEDRTLSSASLNTKVTRFIPRVNILSIYPENIRLQTEDIATKVVPIILEEQIRLAPLYQYVDSIQITPTKVEIKGPASVIRDIHEWKTNVFIPPNKIDQDIDQDIFLKKHSNSNISCSVDRVHCVAKVEEITEKSIEVPVEVLNVPDSLLLVILPQKITLNCRIGLSDYTRLDASYFKAIVDFETVDLYQEKNIRVRLRAKPNFVQQVQYFPKKVDYIIRSRNL